MRVCLMPNVKDKFIFWRRKDI
ncbi:hypothetical protein CP8484711_0710A, partial [Chlamydia psittaci 84-8471/1]